MRRLDKHVVTGGVTRLSLIVLKLSRSMNRTAVSPAWRRSRRVRRAPGTSCGWRVWSTVVEGLEGQLLLEGLAFSQIARVEDDARRVAVEQSARRHGFNGQPAPVALAETPLDAGALAGERMARSRARRRRRISGWAMSVKRAPRSSNSRLEARAPPTGSRSRSWRAESTEMIRSDEFMTSQPKRASDLRRAISISRTSRTDTSWRISTGRRAPTRLRRRRSCARRRQSQHEQSRREHEEIQARRDPAAQPAIWCTRNRSRGHIELGPARGYGSFHPQGVGRQAPIPYRVDPEVFATSNILDRPWPSRSVSTIAS